ncbi:MAG: methylated-DNA--[protein]-cysteine S-methyltransferase [Chloroflexi bacterium]|nr:methylated-DNA--[protein]-cysteine S-methyltransferase [Chloroflexota bacterium]
MIAASSATGLCRLMPPGAGMDDLHAWADQYARDADLVPDPAADMGLQDQLDGYFARRRRDFDVPLDLRGTPFQRAVWRAVMAIPFGETRSYADIARTVGRPAAWRAVGAANAVSPVSLVIPCHRVIGADGTIKGYAGGALNRRTLLAFEQSAPPTQIVP